MRRNRLFTAITLAAALALTACTQDELAENPDILPPGKYPLEIGSVTLSVEGGEAQPWGAKSPQTRVSENTDGNSSKWDGSETIYVKIGNGTPGTYVLNADGTIDQSKSKPAYWTSTQSGQSIRAWYTNPEYTEESTITLSDQEDGLAYLLSASTTANFNSTVTLRFSHALAKVRVNLEGNNYSKVTAVKIQSYTTCTHNQGEVSGTNEGEIIMHKVNDKTYEANVVPGYTINKIKVNNDKNWTDLSKPISPVAGAVNTITLTVKGRVPDDAKEITGNISDNGNYVVRGTRNETINITGGSPNIYLDGASINVGSGCGISITGGTPTIHVVGKDNKVTAANGAGIYVAQSYTVTITGNGREDVLTAEAGVDAAGIGGCSNKQDCGSININNVTVIARSASFSFCSPGIGSTQTNKCGDITIDNATVHAYGGGVSNTCACPGIGAGLDISGNTGTISPNVTIKNNSEVHAHRGNNYADYIGISYFMTSGGGQVRATIDQTSVVMKYTGDGNTPDQ